MDLILYNGIGYTMDKLNPIIEAIAIKGNIIKSAGMNEDILALKNEETILIDLHKASFIPGFNDSHLHLYGTGKFLSQLNLLETTTLREVKNKINDYIKKNKNLKYYLGRGWNQDYFTDTNEYLTRNELDIISKKVPIVMTRACGHVLTANSKAIELAGITEDTKVEDGTIDLNRGVFTENALELIYNSIPEPTIEQVKEMLVKGMEHANSFGITSLQTDDLTQGGDIHRQLTLQAYLELQEEGKLTCRIYEQSLLPKIKFIDEFIDAGFNTGIGDDFFKIGPLKLLADGSLGARTAALKQPYADDQSTSGMYIYETEYLREIISFAHQKGMQIAVHCIGDGALEQVMGIYEDVLIKHPREDHRHGIVHCQIMNEDLQNRFAKNNIIAYIQPIFIHYDHKIVRSRVGEDLEKTSYAFKSLLDKGVNIAIGTDSPIELLNPFNNIYTAVTRKSLNFQPENGWLPNEALSIDEAIHGYTIGSAYASFDENVKGILKEGYLADITVLSKDLYNITEEEILNTEALLTIVDGRVVYEKDWD